MEGKVRKAIKDLSNANPATQAKAGQVLDELFVKTPASRKVFLSLAGFAPVVAACSNSKDKSVIERCLAVMRRLVESDNEMCEHFIKAAAIPALAAMCDDMFEYAHASVVPVLELLCTNEFAAAQAIDIPNFVQNVIRICANIGDAVISTAGAVLVGTMCFCGGLNVQRAFDEAGVCKELLALVNHGDGKIEAMRALQAVTLKEENLEALVTGGGLNAVVSMLKSSSEDSTRQIKAYRHAAGVIRNLAREAKNREAIANTGVLVPIVELLKSADPDTLVQSASATRYLALTASIAQSLAELDAIPLLLELCKKDDDRILIEATSAVANLCKEHAMIRDQVGETGGIEIVAELLLHANVDVCIISVAALTAGCIENAGNRDRACEKGVVPTIVSLIKASPNLDVQRVCCEAITQLCFEHSRNKLAVNRHGGLPALIPLIRSSVPIISQRAAEAVNAACVAIELNQNEARRVGCIAALIEASRSMLPPVRGAAQTALSTLGLVDIKLRSNWPLEPRIPYGFAKLADANRGEINK